MSMNSADIRSAYRNFFVKRGHKAFSSDSLIPRSDPTLLFTSAGMVQFKPYFLGLMGDSVKRATSCQKCFRTSDIENVGRTARHHTFFEMLGNFSFGDYFKQDAIRWAWEFVTDCVQLDKSKLWATVFRDDDEAAKIWEQETDVKPDRIFRMGEKDNFWMMGDTGPCGPCSEIIYDQGPNVGCGKPNCSIECGCDRYLEIWNLVFTQFDRQSDGSLEPLPRKNIDTGMGLERITAVVQGVYSNFDTDLFKHIIREIENLSGYKYGSDNQNDVSVRILADHSRSMTFAIADNILPSNLGRGYVLRRIMRRAIRHGKFLGLSGGYLSRLCEVVANTMGDEYVDIIERLPFTKKIVESEHDGFISTLERGVSMLNGFIDDCKASGVHTLSGDKLFLLYDTYGFPVEIAKEMIVETGLAFDEEGFSSAMEQQRSKARAAWKGSGEELDISVKLGLKGETKYLDFSLISPNLECVNLDSNEVVNGQTAEIYCCSQAETFPNVMQNAITHLISDKYELVDSLKEGESGFVILATTPFYAEKGGQAGDIGFIELADNEVVFQVEKVLASAAGLILHQGKLIKGLLSKENISPLPSMEEVRVRGKQIKTKVDWKRRQEIAVNHTATHLLHAALREVLGDHVKQSGSQVYPDGFRFDFSHYEGMSSDEISKVEEKVNYWISQNIPLEIKFTSIDKAREEGAIALFGEKYGEVVRVVRIDDISMELCGGTHISRTGDIGLFRITSESSISAGIRRIEALTGKNALQYVKKRESVLDDLKTLLKTSIDVLPKQVNIIIDENKSLKKQIEQLSLKSVLQNIDEMISKSVPLGDLNLISSKIEAPSQAEMSKLADAIKPKVKRAIIFLIADIAGKVSIMVSVTDDIEVKSGGIHAGEIASETAKMAGGSGGGNPKRAQAGAKNPSAISDILKKLPEIIQKRI